MKNVTREFWTKLESQKSHTAINCAKTCML